MRELTAKALVSVIIPTYNRAHIIGRTLDSVINQSYRNLEIIVIDDGSGDGTEEVINILGDPRVRYIRHKENYGGAIARNTGIAAARGEYIAFLDSDDIWLPRKVEIQLASIQKHLDPERIVSYTQLVWVENCQNLNSDKKVPPRGKGETEALGDYLFCHQGVMQTSTLMLKRSLATANPFRPLPMLQDLDFYLRLETQGAIFSFLEELLTICDTDQGRERVSDLGCKFQIFIKWILEYQSSISWKATEKSICDYVLPYLTNRKKRFYAEILFFKGFANRFISFQQFKELTGLVWANSRYLLKIKKVPKLIAQPTASAPARRSLMMGGIGDQSSPPVGQVHFGSLRRVDPISRHFGFDRGLPLDRYYIEKFLAHQAADIQGRVLEVGDDSYTRRYGGDWVTRRDVLHVKEGNPLATIAGDLTKADHIPSDTFDCFILTQTLHLIYDTRAALQTIYRILKPGGVLLATFPGISQISHDQWSETWYWSFTCLSARRLLEEVFPKKNIQVESFGNVLAAIGFLQGIAKEELLEEELDYQDKVYQLLITVRAQK